MLLDHAWRKHRWRASPSADLLYTYAPLMESSLSPWRITWFRWVIGCSGAPTVSTVARVTFLTWWGESREARISFFVTVLAPTRSAVARGGQRMTQGADQSYASEVPAEIFWFARRDSWGEHWVGEGGARLSVLCNVKPAGDLLRLILYRWRAISAASCVTPSSWVVSSHSQFA